MGTDEGIVCEVLMSDSRLFRSVARVLSRRLSVVVPVAYMAALLVSACVPTDGSEITDRHFLWFLALVPVDVQNFLHIPAYGLLAFLWRWSLSAMHTRPAVIVSFALTMAFGIAQEWAQSLVPGRFASLSDILFDALGAGLGLWAYTTIRVKSGKISPA